MLCQCLLPHHLAESSVWLPSPRVVSHGNNKREKGGVIRAGWEQRSGKPSFESTFFSKPQTRLPKWRLTHRPRLWSFWKSIWFVCIWGGYSLGGGKPRDLLQSPLNLLMSGNPSYLPYARRSFHVLYQHTMCVCVHTHAPQIFSPCLRLSQRTQLEQSCCSHTFFFWGDGSREEGKQSSRVP